MAPTTGSGPGVSPATWPLISGPGPCSVQKAMLASVVPTLTGNVRLKLPAGARGGQKLRLAGRGMPVKEAKERARVMLEEIQNTRLGGYAKCELFVEIGDPFGQLMEIAKQRNIDLIVISTHGRSGLEHLVMGNVAEKLIRHAPCPTLVVRRGVD